MPGATIQPDQDLFSLDVEDTRKAVDLNLFGTLIPTLVFGQAIAEKGKGAIVNISSLTAQRPFTRVLGYTLAKKAVVAYTQWMAVELGMRYGGSIRINAIAPGVFLTEQNRVLNDYRQAAREIAKQYGAAFIPYQSIFDKAQKSAPAEYWTDDGVHPTIAGNRLMAQAWLDTVGLRTPGILYLS